MDIQAQKRREARRRKILQNAEQRLEKVFETKKDIKVEGLPVVTETNHDEVSVLNTISSEKETDINTEQADSKQWETKHKENVTEYVDFVDPSHTGLEKRECVPPPVSCPAPSWEKSERETKPKSVKTVIDYDNEYKPQDTDNQRQRMSWRWKAFKTFIIGMLATLLVFLYHFQLIETSASIKRTSFLVYFGLLEVIILKYFTEPELDDKYSSLTITLLLLAIRLCGVHKKILDLISKIQAVISHVLDDLTVFVFALVMVNVFVRNNTEVVM